MTPEEFMESIDCSFPYDKPHLWGQIVELGASLSPNAAFMVLHEICRPPQSASPTPHSLLALLELWREKVSHPLAKELSDVAERMIRGQYLSPSEAEDGMRRVAGFPGLYNALNILYFSCKDGCGIDEELFEAIRDSWKG